MSSNFLINMIVQTPQNKKNTYENISNEILKRKTNKDVDKSKKHITKNIKQELYFSQDKKNSNLENSYKNSLVLLEMIQKQTEKNIFEKYNNNYDSLEKNIKSTTSHQHIQNILMKKKFLITVV